MTLRIQRSTERNAIVIRLTGRIQSDHLSQLELLVNSASADVPLILDLAEVRLVDRDAVQFLSSQEASGTRLRHCSAYIREWISQERARLQAQRQRSGEAQKLGE